MDMERNYVTITLCISRLFTYLLRQVRALPGRRWQRAVWLFCEEPDSSLAARVFAVVSVACILVSISNFCTEMVVWGFARCFSGYRMLPGHAARLAALGGSRRHHILLVEFENAHKRSPNGGFWTFDHLNLDI